MASIEAKITVEEMINALEDMSIFEETDFPTVSVIHNYGRRTKEVDVDVDSSALVDHADLTTLMDAAKERPGFIGASDVDSRAVIDLAQAIRSGNRDEAERALDVIVSYFPDWRDLVDRGRYHRRLRAV